MYADKQLLQAFPDLLRAKVYVHFQSDVQVGAVEMKYAVSMGGGGQQPGGRHCDAQIRAEQSYQLPAQSP